MNIRGIVAKAVINRAGVAANESCSELANSKVYIESVLKFRGLSIKVNLLIK